jgi:hypothetical protein
VLKILDIEAHDGESSDDGFQLKYEWLACSAFVIVLLSDIASYLICLAMRWPNLTKVIQVGKYYWIDTGALSDFTNGSSARLLANANAAKPDVTIHGNARVDFVTNCAASMFQPSTGIVWNLEPEYKITCGNVPAIVKTKVALFRQTKCGLTSRSPAGKEGIHDG